MAIHSSILAWRILWTEEHIDPSGIQFHLFSLHVPPNADKRRSLLPVLSHTFVTVFPCALSLGLNLGVRYT